MRQQPKLCAKLPLAVQALAPQGRRVYGLGIGFKVYRNFSIWDGCFMFADGKHWISALCQAKTLWQEAAAKKIDLERASAPLLEVLQSGLATEVQ